jgi:hypothetical protein
MVIGVAGMQNEEFDLLHVLVSLEHFSQFLWSYLTELSIGLFPQKIIVELWLFLGVMFRLFIVFLRLF